MLEISLLGEIKLQSQDKPLTHFRSQKELALLVYLAHTGQTHGRETVADLLWEARSTKQSLSNLRTALARLRTQAGDFLVITRSTVAVSRAVHDQTDTVRFEAMLAGVGQERSTTAVNLLVQGLKLYRGEFMAGFSLPDTPRFNDWLIIEQERLRQIALRGYRQLAAWQEEEGSFAAGIITAQEWVAWDPLDETAHQQLMRLLAYEGRVAEALAVYARCRDILEKEMGIAPAPAMFVLYQAIQTGTLPAPDISPVPLHNLPRALTPLFGRAAEIERLNSYVLNDAYPLICVTGPGGIGKTSLALAVGRGLVIADQHPFADGIWLVPLEEIENAAPAAVRDEVAAKIGEAIGLVFRGERDLWSQLLEYLTNRKTLLILDNVEQFLEIAADLIVELLEAGENVQLLVTSSTTLPLSASRAFPLTGLEAPAEVSPAALYNESVLLFAERAARLPVPFELNNHVAEVVAICRFVEGVPLAIELAAASLGRLLMGEIMPALASNLQLLETARRDLPPRQRTLRAVFEYAYQLLDPREQMTLAQISVFRGGFTRQAAEAVLSDSPNSLYNLLDHALLSRDAAGRFRVHPLSRQFAREKLDNTAVADLAAATSNRHSRYFAAFLQSFAADVPHGLDQATLQSILDEQANLRAAWQHAVQNGQWPVIADSLEMIHYCYQRKGFSSEEAALVDSAMAALQAATGAEDVSSIRLRSRLLTARAYVYRNSAQFDEAVQAAEQACELAQILPHPALEAKARLARADALATQHQREAALLEYERVNVLAKSVGNQILEADSLIGIGAQLFWRADISPAQEPLDQALELCQTLQYRTGQMETLIMLGDLANRQGAFPKSLEYDRQALQISRLLGDVIAEARVLASLGVALKQLDDLPGSQRHLREALSTFQRLNMPEKADWVLGELGHSAIELGDYDGAAQDLMEALTIAEDLNDEFWGAWVKLRLAALRTEQGRPQEALIFIAEALPTAEQRANPRFLAAVLYAWGNALLSQEAWAAAEEKYQQAHTLRQEAGQAQLALPPLAGLAFTAYQQGKVQAAAVHAEQVWQTWQASPTWAETADLKLYWMLGSVWDGLGDYRANDLWQTAQALLRARADQIPDGGRAKAVSGGAAGPSGCRTALRFN